MSEVGPRDGLQTERRGLPPVTRAELVRLLAAAGLRRIEVASFVSPRRVPQMSGAEEVVRWLDLSDDVAYSGLVLNQRGLVRLHAAGLREVHFVIPATDAFALENQGTTIDGAIRAVSRMVAVAREAGITPTATVAVAFGCPFTGRVADAAVLRIVQRLVELDLREIVLADTIGVAAPGEVRRLIAAVAKFGVTVGAHLHDTRSLGFANGYAALQGGATVLDASIGGLGGCPFAPGASGNIRTEGLCYMLEREGVSTGIDLDRLVDAAEWIARTLGRDLQSTPFRPSRPGDTAPQTLTSATAG